MIIGPDGSGYDCSIGFINYMFTMEIKNYGN